MKSNTYLFFIMCCLFHAFLWGDIDYDLEDVIQDFLLETHKIIIPNFPHAFNPSIVRWNGKLLMSFRVIVSNTKNDLFHSSADSRIGLVWLDEDFQPLSQAFLLDLDQEKESLLSSRSEDPRLVIIDGRLYLIFSSNTDVILSEGGFRMFVAQLDFDGTKFQILNMEKLSLYDKENPLKREKNWVPFSFNNELFLGYSIVPHRIFKPLFDGYGTCKTLCTSKGSIVWEWGELRGGTPALYNEEEDEYLAFFHSSLSMSTVHSKGKDELHYFMGAYTFSSKPPFEITRISPEPIVGKDFYHGNEYDPYWQAVRVVFPCGFFFDGQFIWVSYGRQDHEVWVAKLDRKALLESLIQVTTLKKR